MAARLFFLFLSFIILASAPAQSPRRVVSFSPNITETIYALGAQDLLVGVSEFCVWPPEAKKDKKICGGYINPNFELISSLKPDLLICDGDDIKIRRFCQDRGIRFEHIHMKNLATIHEGMKKLGALLGRAQQADDLLHKMDADLAALRDDRATTQTRPKVFVAIGRQTGSIDGIYTVAGGSFLDEMLTLVGGQNIFGELTQAYPEVSKESLLARQPEIILDLSPGVDQADVEKLKRDWQRMHSLPAVRNGKVYAMNGDFLLKAGPRLPLLAKALKDTLRQATETHEAMDDE